MYSITNVNLVKSYATEANAVKAIEKKFGPADGTGRRICNFMMVRNHEGRFVPIAINIDPGMIGAVAHAGFMCVN